jgi:hypothetical protein
MPKKIQTIFSLIEIAESNLKNAKTLLAQMLEDHGDKITSSINLNSPVRTSKEEDVAREVVEGYFDGENMIGDNGRTYIVPQNYASKTQLVVGDRMKWILTTNREVFKLIQPVERQKVEGEFCNNDENFYVKVDGIDHPIRILKASATFAMKTQSLKTGDIVSVLIPLDTKAHWGAFLSIVRNKHEHEEYLKNKTSDVNNQDEILNSHKIEVNIEKELEDEKFSELDMFKDVIDPEHLVKKNYPKISVDDDYL